jgi:hypothetical protein
MDGYSKGLQAVITFTKRWGQNPCTISWNKRDGKGYRNKTEEANETKIVERMKKIEFVIERSQDMYCVYSQTVEGGYGCGLTVQEAKNEALKGLTLYYAENGMTLEEYEPVWVFDVESLLHYYKGIFTLAAMERITGINQRQLGHYIAGIKKPRKPQRQKIISGLHSVGAELLSLV